MSAKAKKITLYLENGTLDGLVNIGESSGWDFSGELYSCPRDKVEDLTKNSTLYSKAGVYLLLGNDKVYIGQSIDLYQRIKQHKLSKDWWEKVILLTSKTNELNQSHITYLEGALIQKAIECGTADSENKTFGNHHNLDKFETILLDQYLDEAYFILELIGENVFIKDSTRNYKHNIIPPTPKSSESDLELRAKGEAEKFVKSQGVTLTRSVSYAKLQEKKNWYWINPKTKFLNEEWTLILNNQITKKLYVLKVPKNTFGCSLYKDTNCLIIRKDKPFYLDLNIFDGSFVDARSQLSFKPFIIKEFDY